MAHGTYVVGTRPGDERSDACPGRGHRGDDRATASCGASSTAWKLWDDSQANLASPPTDGPVAKAAPPETGSLDGRQVLLFLQGAALTVLVSFASFAIAMPLGMLLAAARIGSGALGRALATAYVEAFRGTPVLLQLYVLYFGLAPVLKLGAMTAAIVGLGLNYAAYEAEVYRGAMLAIPRGSDRGRRGAGSRPLADPPARVAAAGGAHGAAGRDERLRVAPQGLVARERPHGRSS